MRNSLILILGLVTAVSFANESGVAHAQDKSAGRTLTVKLKYTGAGTVDDKHLIQVFLWDSADFASGGGSMPIRMKGSPSKNGTLVFSDLDKSPVYISAAYDPKGNYNEPSGPPPSGSSAGMYSKSPGIPEPVKIEPGGKAEVEIEFDDSFKMP